MSERYSKVFSLPENLYAEGAPVVIAAGALLKDNQTGRVVAQLKLRNISPKTIKAATVSILPLNTVGNPLGETIRYEYLDLSSTRDTDFGSKSAISMPDITTRSFDAAVVEVIFADNSIWNASEAVWEALKSPEALTSQLDNEMVKQFQIEYGSGARNFFLEQKDLWHCVCGAVNRRGEEVCHSCRKSIYDTRDIDLEALKEHKEQRLVKEQDQAAKKAAATQKTMKTLAAVLVVAAVFCIVASFAVGAIKKNKAYNDAALLMEQGKYEEAIEAFTVLGDYKDSPDQIANSQKAIEDAKQYEEAVSLFRKKEYDQASSIFASLEDYRDAPSYVQKLSDRQALEYNDALYYLEQGEYTEAYSLFTELSGYEDSDEYLTHFHYVPVTGSVAYYAIYSNSRRLDAKYTIEYTCDNRGQVVHEKHILDNDTPAPSYSSLVEHDYTYDDKGHLIKDAVQSSYDESADIYDTVIIYTYDAAGNEIEYKHTHKGEENEPYYTCTLNDDGLLEEKTYLTGAYAGKTYVFLYDSAKRVLGYEFNIGEYGTATRKYSYTYDARGNLTSKEMGNGLQKYFYDDNSRLISYQNVDEKSGLAGVEKTYSYGWVYFPENG